MVTRPDTSAAAVAAAERGCAVFPCRPNDKRPAVAEWERRACADPERVARYWPGPCHNIGIACGPSRLVGIDLDAHGELPPEWRLPGLADGRDVFAQLAEWAGQPWPGTHMVMTASEGWHLYYAAPAGTEVRNSAGQLGPLVDVRGAGGYLIAAGSVIASRRYEALDDDPPEPLPGWLTRLLAPIPQPSPSYPRLGAGTAEGRLGGLVRTVRDSQPGDRTGPLRWATCRLREMVAAGEARLADGELLVQAAVAAGIDGGERYARYQVGYYLGDAR